MFITQVQQSVQRFLSDHPFFKGEGNQIPIPVFAANDKNLIRLAQQSMGRISGICVIVAGLGGDYSSHDGGEPYFDPARFTCRVRENPQTNRGSNTGSGMPADYVAEVCAQVLKNHRPTAIDGTTYLTGSGIICTGISPGEDEPGIIAFDMVFTCDGGVRHDPVRLDFANSPLPGDDPPTT